MARMLPAIFFGHGNPMNAVTTNGYTEAWRRMGQGMPRPKAILSISAHWFVPQTGVTVSTAPSTIHDFGGFPPELYQVKYPAPGDPALARRVQRLLAPLDVTLDDSWGFDHGTWSVLKHAYPKADIPGVQLSIDETKPAPYHFEIGRKLAPLREEGVLIAGSGNPMHNLHAYAWGRHASAPYDWAVRFESVAREIMLSGAYKPLVEYETLGRDAALSAPTPEQADEATISMVHDYPQNVDPILGENGLLSAHVKGKTIIVMSTLDPDLMGDLGEKVEAESDVKLVSAAVSGGASGAQAGILSIMTAGAEDIVKSFKPYFDAIGSNTFYYGANPGNSQVAELANNMILGITMNAVAEGLKLGEDYKLPKQEILNLLKVSTGDSWVVRNWSDVENWTAETALAVLLKDLKSAFLEGIKHNVALPFNALSATALYNAMGKENPEAHRYRPASPTAALAAQPTPFYPMGEKPQGIIMYTSDGYMPPQLMQPDRPPFASGDWFRGSDEEFKEEALGNIAYGGSFHTDEDKQTLTHSMFVSLFPNWVGPTQPRAVKIEGDMLHLNSATPIMSGGKRTMSYLSWRRAEPNV